uniref:Tensin 1 n=1 Tax=Mesocestoides corti TaxID=53468 RepID=A0A0R3UN84_MESCO
LEKLHGAALEISVNGLPGSVPSVVLSPRHPTPVCTQPVSPKENGEFSGRPSSDVSAPTMNVDNTPTPDTPICAQSYRFFVHT